MKIPEGFKLRLEDKDDYTHSVEEAKNYNESVYINIFDHAKVMGGWFRIGNRPNEGYAEMTCCIYLPDGSIGFFYDRPKISNNDAWNAGGMAFDIVTPFKKMRLTYEGKILLLKNPKEMSHPRSAFKSNPILDCSVALDYYNTAPTWGGEVVHEDGRPMDLEAEKSFARAHYEQHVGGSGMIKVGDQEWKVEGLGLRDHSWGPRYWQSIFMYRWLPMSFTKDFSAMISVVEGEKGKFRRSGVIQKGNVYHNIVDTKIETDWDEDWYQTGMKAWAKTDEGEYEITGKVISLIPLRNKRQSPEGEVLHTRITEAITEFTCNGKVGYGMSEYLDQIVDGKPVGSDVS